MYRLLLARLLLLGCSILARAYGDDRWGAFSQLGWSSRHDPGRDPDQLLVTILALRQQNIAFLEGRARRVSDPLASEYGMYYTLDEVNSIAGPSDHHVDIVRDFLRPASGGGPEPTVTFSRGRDLVRFACSVECTERTFGTRLAVQGGPVQPGNSPFRAIEPIRLPGRVAEVLDGVSLNAPIFMPRRPKKPPRPLFHYPKEGRQAPKISWYLLAGDQFLTLRFVVYCKDGRVNSRTLEEGLCSGSGPGGVIVSVEVLVLQHPNMQKVVQLPAAAELLGQRPGHCAAPCVEFNVTVGNLQNFLNTTARIRAHFADGSVSPFSGAGELYSVFPLPYTTPSVLSKFYGLPLNKPLKHARNIVSVAEFMGQYYNPADLETFFRLMGVRSWHGEGRTQPRIIGHNLPVAGSVYGGESQLDIQYIMAMAANVTTWFWSVPGKELATYQEPFLDWLMQVADSESDTTPLVHSVSYGDDAGMMPDWFKRRINEEFMKLALRGISVLIASGDDGASGIHAKQNPEWACRTSRPEFPSTSPWVTAVGGTQISKAATPVCRYVSDTTIVNCQEDGEVACSSETGGVITSGGGFSNDFAQPWYQAEAVRSYVAQTDSRVPPVHGPWRYNATGRAYPDIAAVASNFLVWMGNDLEAMSGTSASTPLIAAMVARWNEVRLQRNLPPLGFLNPLLYRMAQEHPEAFHDVVIGDNRCSSNVSRCCRTGFGAARGWDAVTGWGSPKFDVIEALLLAGVVAGAPPPAFGALGAAAPAAAVQLAPEALAGPAPRPPWPSWSRPPYQAALCLGLAGLAASLAAPAWRWWRAPGDGPLRAALLERPAGAS